MIEYVCDYNLKRLQFSRRGRGFLKLKINLISARKQYPESRELVFSLKK